MPDDISLFDRPLKDGLTVLHRHLCIQNAHRLNPHQRTHLAETVTATLLHRHRSVAVSDLRTKLHRHIRIALHQLAHFLINLPGTARQTAGTGTDQNSAFTDANHLLCVLSQLIQHFSVLDSHFFLLSQPSERSSSISSAAASGVIAG